MSKLFKVYARNIYLSLDGEEPALIVRPPYQPVKGLSRVIAGVFTSPEPPIGGNAPIEFQSLMKRYPTRFKRPALPEDLRAEWRDEYLSSVWRVENQGQTHLFVLTSTTTNHNTLAKHHGTAIKGYLDRLFSGPIKACSLDSGRYPIQEPIASRRWRLTLDAFSGEMTALDYCSIRRNNAE